jgi:hypothetical protein
MARPWTQAIAGVSKDLYGDVQVVNQPHAQIIIPTNQDPSAVLAGLSTKLPEVETALKQALVLPDGVDAADGTKAVISAAAANHIPNVLANGFFRNSGDGYVFIDPYTGLAVSDQNEQPIIFKLSGNIPMPQPGPVTNLGTNNPQQLNQMRRSMGQ